MKVDISLAMAGPMGAAERAAELAALGTDGLFSFENAHDVFFPLVMATAHSRFPVFDRDQRGHGLPPQSAAHGLCRQ